MNGYSIGERVLAWIVVLVVLAFVAGALLGWLLS